ncbi:TniQ family protein [Paenibacillus sp. P25]|nr:TniQ family protein [Paenibacillus sp. P25]
MSRYHQLSTNRGAKNTLKQLFELDQMLGFPELPRRVGKIVSVIPGKHSFTTTDLVYRHTLYPYFACFMLNHKRMLLKQMMEDEITGYMHLNKRYTKVSSLKYCPSCLIADQKKAGEPYWHNSHQPGAVYYCPVHHRLLMNGCPRCNKTFRISTDNFLHCKQVLF